MVYTQNYLLGELPVPDGCIYLLRCLVGKKKGYVGQCARSTVEPRWAGHINEALAGTGFAIHAAIRKYGYQNFSAEIIWCGPIHLLNEMETKFITELATFAPAGYNLTLGGQGSTGRKFTKAQRLRMSEYGKQYHREHPEAAERVASLVRGGLPPKQRATITAALKSEPTRKLMSKSAKRRWSNSEARTALAATVTTLWQNEQYKATMAAAQSVRWSNPEEHVKSSLAHKRQMSKSGMKQQISASVKALWQDPVYRARMLEAQRLRRLREKETK